ncbi:PREDICTED: protocadherin alpha-9-like [Condylura cristata]|uniref:protocadherin alpha-9-like n=1 Tax=Condylura cristata TaxID=143302 RepID=UPI000643D412|nr:PREDICTED: protocadherin alpha-9-like [Condylura cristata]
MVFSWREGQVQRLLVWLLLLAICEAGSGQVHYSVSEEAKHGTFVGRIAQDLGLELADLVPRLFRMASKGRGDLLEVNLQNGILFVNSRIDREELCGRSAECSLHLEVIVDRPLQVFHVEVEVKDINDNPPVFPMTLKKLFISESRPPGSRIPLEGASDADIGANSLSTYNLNSNDYFTLDVKRSDEEIKSLGLVLKKNLNREDIPEHHLLITAVDGGKPELTGTIQLKVTVLDVNDNAPEFEKTVYKVRLFENAPNGTIVVVVNASDLDEGANKDIVYSFNADTPADTLSKFHLNPVSGYISVKGNIDFEETKLYEIQVEARDKGNPPMVGHCTVLVEILDTNDNIPELVIKSLSLPVLEDAPQGTVIALISVSDRDSGANGKVTCNLIPHSPFKLVSTFKNYYSLVLDSALDRENMDIYEVVVTARDGGSPPLSATASVSVEVADVNDNAPAFATTRALDEADAPRQRLLVLVKDHGEPALTATATVLLSLVESGVAPKAASRASEGAAGARLALVDVNVYLIVAICAVSSLLVLTLLLYVALRCSAPPREGACAPGKPALVCSSAVGSWSCSQQRRPRVCSGEGPPKADLMAFSPSLPPGPISGNREEQLGMDVDLSAKKGELDMNFQIPTKTKVIRFLFNLETRSYNKNKALRFEMEFSWGSCQESKRLLLSLLLLTAWDMGSGQVRYSVPEEAKHGTFVGRIAQDLGLELADLVPRLFRVASKGRGDLLEVNLQNGILFVNSRIDREELCGRSAECSLHLEVIVDRPLQVFHVEVEVKDINDNPPVFPATQKNLFVAESRPLDSRFPLEGASDADIGENAQLTYRLSPNEYFSLEKPSENKRAKRLGLVLRKPLDREVSPELHLTLTATDGGKPELTGSVQLLVNVLDANDNAPAFHRELYTVKLPENAPNGTLVIKLNASDLDEGANGEIIYSFSNDISPNVKSRFYVDPNTGEIVVNGNIDFEESKSYEILVEGIDKGQLPLSGHCTVVVEVEDTNDNMPVIEFKSLSLPIREDAPLGTVIALISVSDRDSSANGKVTCTVTPHAPFKLVSTFKNYYSLVLDRALDRESVSNYEVVRRKSGSWRLLLSLLFLTVWEEGSGQVSYSVMEEAKHGTFVGRIAQDLGLELADLVPRLFRVASKGRGDLLEVNLQNGILFVNSRIDREELCGRSAECSLHLEVIVDRPLQVFHVEVEVKDINDNAPRFLRQEQRLFILESRMVDSRFPLEGASDMDTGANAELRYMLSPSEHFDLDVKTNEEETKFLELVLKKPVDREETQEHRLILTAIDGGKPELTGTVQLLINVLDANDNAPEFDKSIYNVRLSENVQNGTLVIKLNASDADEGINKEVVYLFSNLVLDKVKSKFTINSNSGEIRVKGKLDYEDCKIYEINIDAVDKSPFPLTGHCKVIVKILDENDNTPEMVITSLSLPVQEDSPLGTVIALISVSDLDSGVNGQPAHSFIIGMLNNGELIRMVKKE